MRHYFKSQLHTFFGVTPSLLFPRESPSSARAFGGGGISSSSCSRLLSRLGPRFSLHFTSPLLSITPSLSIIPRHCCPPHRAGCRLAISCTRPVEPLSALECWLLVCLSGWLTVGAALLKCLIWSMFVCGALSPHLILTALTVCAGSFSPSCCTSLPPPPPPPPPSILCLYLHSLSTVSPLYSLSAGSQTFSCWSSSSIILPF